MVMSRMAVAADEPEERQVVVDDIGGDGATGTSPTTAAIDTTSNSGTTVKASCPRASPTRATWRPSSGDRLVVTP
jgi:hypothetical protein